MRVWLDPDKLAAYRLTVQDVEDALRRQNLEVPAGRIESRQREFSVTSRTDLNTVPQFNDIALKTVNGYTWCACATWPGWRKRPPANAVARAAQRCCPVHQHGRDPQCHGQPAGSGRWRSRG